MTRPMSNGNAQRKQLSAQLDRLDTVLGSLADALNRSVADAVKDVVGQAVKEAMETTIWEVLGNPVLHVALAQHPPQQPPASEPIVMNPGVWQWLGGVAQAAWGWVGRKASHACGVIVQAGQTCTGAVATGVGTTWARAQSVASGVWFLLGLLWALACQSQRAVVTASGVGLAVGLACYLAGPVAASTISGFAGFAGSLVARVARNQWHDRLALSPRQG